jgi:hypothetical protein
MTWPGVPITLHYYPDGGADVEFSPLGGGGSVSWFPTNTIVIPQPISSSPTNNVSNANVGGYPYNPLYNQDNGNGQYPDCCNH